MKQTNYFNYSRRSRWLLPVVMLFALLTSANPAWGDEFIVNGTTTTTNTYIPLEGNYADTNGSRSEFILPESALEGMVGNITQMSFELVSTTSFTATYQVYLKIVDNTEFVYENYKRYFAGIEGSTTVYEGVLNGSSTTLNIEFNQNGGSFNYTGGNLLVGFLVTTKGSYESTSFKGVSGSYCALYSHSNGSPTGDNVNFLPKVTFTYTPSGAVVVPKPKNVTAGSITATGATIGWDVVDGADSYELSCSTSSVEPDEEGIYTSVNTNSYNLTGLTGGTLYYVYVRTIKGGDKSKWSTVCSLTPGTLTINNVSTTTNNYVPIYGNYMDDHSRSQFVLPKASLTSLSGTQITKIVFYGTANNTAKFANKTFDVYMKEVDDAFISTLSDWASLEQVYSGNLTIIDGKMTIILDEGFDYSGDKNLLIGLNQTDDDKDYTYTEWTGISATGASMGGYGSSISQQNFLPQTTFYFAPQTATVKKPKNLAASATATTTATLGWTDGEDGLTEWQIAYSTATDFNPDSEGTKVAADANPFTLTELTAATTYYAYVRAKKAEEYSSWSNKAEFTTLSAVPIIELSTTNHNFGMVSDADAQALTLTISNTGGAALTGLTVTPTSGFAVTDMEGNALTTTEIAASSTLSVKVKMSALGQQDGTITIDGNEIDAQEVTVSGYMLDNSKIAETFTSAVPEHWTEYAYKTQYSTYNWSYSADGAYNTNENSTLSTPKIMVAEGQALVVYGKLKSSATYGYILVEGSSDNGETWTAYSKKLDYAAFSNTTNVFQLLTLDNIPTTINKLRFKCYYAYLNTINGFTYAPDPVLSLYSDEECTAAISTVVSKSFGLITESQSEKYYIKNTGTGQIDLTVNEPTGFTATIDDAALTDDEVATLTITMPATEGTHDDAIVVTAKNHDTDDVLGTFTVNATGALRDANKFYQEFNTTSLPDGWTTDGNWYYNTINGAYTQAWYIDQGTLTRLKTPILTVAAGEKFIIEAKGLSTNNTSYQHIVLQYSEDGSNWTTFSDDFGTTTSEDPTNWKSFTATLPNEVEAGNYYIGILASQADIRLFYGGEIVHGANFAINTDGTTQDFGSVRFGTTAEKTYTVTNNGDADLNITFTADEDFTVLCNPNALRNKLKLTDNFNWGEAYVFAWDENGDALLGDWPGTACTETVTNKYDEKLFVVTIPDNAVGIIFNNGWGAQTEDITNFKYDGYWMDGTKNDQGHFIVTGYIDGSDPITMKVAAGESEDFTVKMDTQSSGDKEGNVVLAFDAINATSFTIPCTGNVKDENYLYVDFADGFPAGWQVGADWSATTGSAIQSNTTTASALVTTPLTVAENETMTFQVARNASGYGYNTSLRVRYSQDGGVTWSGYTNYEVNSTSLTEKTLTGVPAGNVIVEFLGSNIKLDNIEGFTNTTKPAIALSEVIEENTTAIASGETKDFGYLSANGTATYRVKNIGNATLNAALSVTEGKGLTVSPANISVAAGETADVIVTLAYGEPYGDRNEMNLTIDSEDEYISDFVVNFEANLVDPDAFVEDFTGGKPAGWYLDTWTVSDGTAHILGTAKPMITELVGAEEGKNTLSFDAKLQYDYGYGTYTVSVSTSTDRKNWSDPQEFTLSATSQTFSLDELSDGVYYVKFEAANAIIDNITGVKKLDAPAHDLYLASATLPTDDITPIDTYTATVKIASLRADEDVTAELYFGETKVSEENLTINNGSTETINISGQAPAAGTYDVYVKVYNANVSVQTENASVTVADKVELSITNFAAVSTAVTADENNNFTAEFNVTVKNTGSTNIDAGGIEINITNNEDVAYSNVTMTNETVFLVPDAYTSDNAKLFIYRWSTDTDQEWDEFTKLSDNLYNADLNGKAKFIVVRKASGASAGWDSDVWNQSENLTAADGICFTFDSWDGAGDKFTAGNEALMPNNATAKFKVAVTSPAADTETYFKFKAQENVSDSWWNSGDYREVKVTPAPAITFSETSSEAITACSNRKVNLTRSFNNGWNTICLPFDVIDLTVFGEDAKVFEFTNFDAGTLEFTMTDGIEAGKPYIIYTPNGQNLNGAPIVFNNVTIAEENTTPSNIEWSDAYFKGTYAPIAAGGWDKTVDTDIIYGVTSEGKIAKAGASATMKGFRAYFDLPANAPAARLAIFDETTGITSVLDSKVLNDGKVYNLKGQRVENATKGLYIVNGKKVVIK